VAIVGPLALTAMAVLWVYWGVTTYLERRGFRAKLEELTELLTGINELDEDMRKTLRLGLYYRYRDRMDGDEKDPDKEEPEAFEDLVTRILADRYGGTGYTTPYTGDQGVDNEISTSTELIYGQSKCKRGDHLVSYEPIALVHSRMVKDGATRGVVVTTSGYTESARAYAEELDIELVDGDRLVAGQPCSGPCESGSGREGRGVYFSGGD